AELPTALLELCNILLVNEVEARALTGCSVDGSEQALAAARELRERGPETTIVTLGGAGAVAVWPDGEAVLPAYTVNAIDTTGAGDAFCGAFVTRLVETADMKDALAWGMAAGAESVQRNGAEPSLPSRQSIIRRMNIYT